MIDMTKLPFLSSISGPDTIAAGQPFELQLQGQWPTPSWSHSETVMKMNEEAKEVEISYLGKSGGGLAMQVIQPFSTKFEVKLPSSGSWKIIILGRGQQLEHHIEVTNQ